MVSILLGIGVPVDGLGDALSSTDVCVVVSTCRSEGDGEISYAGDGDNTNVDVCTVSMGVWVVVSCSTIGNVHMAMNSASYVPWWTIVQLPPGGDIASGHR